MLTIRGRYANGRIYLIDEVPSVMKDQAVLITFLSSDVADAVIPEHHRREILRLMRTPGVMLTARERQVLRKAQEGLKISEIAEELKISHGSTRNHLSSIYKKLGVRNRAEALKKAVEVGLLEPIEPFLRE